MNKLRLCTGCKTRHPVETMIKLPVGWFCRMQCSINYATRRTQRAQERQKKKIEADIKQDFKKRRKALKGRSQWMKEAQSAVNQYIRFRDSNVGCISCGNLPDAKRGGSIDAGHYRSRGAAPHLRFNVFNIHAQCVKCNRWNYGAAVDYRINLIKKIGLERVERLEQDHEVRKFSIEYLERIKRIFNKRAKIYKKLRGIE